MPIAQIRFSNTPTTPFPAGSVPEKKIAPPDLPAEPALEISNVCDPLSGGPYQYHLEASETEPVYRYVGRLDRGPTAH